MLLITTRTAKRDRTAAMHDPQLAPLKGAKRKGTMMAKYI
jgi:hypothetical protein